MCYIFTIDLLDTIQINREEKVIHHLMNKTFEIESDPIEIASTKSNKVLTNQWVELSSNCSRK